MVVGRVADRLVLARDRSQALDVRVARCPQRLLDQHVLAAREQIFQQLDLRLVGRAHQRGIVPVRGHVLHAPVLRLLVDRIDRGDKIRSRGGTSLVPLYAETDDDDSQLLTHSL